MLANLKRVGLAGVMELILLPLFGIAVGIAILIGNQRKQRKLDAEDRRKQALNNQYSQLTSTTCPQCAEDIKLEAKVCRHCGFDVEEHNAAERGRKASEIQDFEYQQAKRRYRQNRGNLSVFLLLGVLFFAVGLLATFWIFVVIGVAVIGLYGFAVWGANKRFKLETSKAEQADEFPIQR